MVSRRQEKKNSFFYAEQYHAFARIAGRLKKQDFLQAESFADRDEVCRAFAAECFGLSKRFAQMGNEKLSLQYAKLCARLLGLSLRPKKLTDLDEIKKAIAKLKVESPGE